VNCGYECHQVGGPWIAENPACPIHGPDGQRRDDQLDLLEDQISQANTVEELRDLMIEMLNILRY
jgi:hypothetical protein